MGVLRFEIGERIPVFEGADFGPVGAYERLTGRAWCDIDPDHPLNAGIVHLDKAPRNAAGRVEYAVDFAMLKPLDLARGNGWIFYEYLNRGTQRGIVRINNAPYVAMPATAPEAGDGFLMRQGHTILWTAWQGNVDPGGGRLIADLPVATEQGAPITGPAREEVVLDAPDSIRGAVVEEVSATRFILTLSYPAATLDPAEARLTVRAAADDPREERAGVTWRYLDDRRVEVDTDPSAGVDRGAIYEFAYTARDPVVMGIGYASIRDLLAFLRHETHDAAGNPNPLAPDGVPAIRRALGFGLSQSGRVLRDFLYQGFNEDIVGRPVFDGVVPIIGGSRRAWVNAPFSQPGRYSREHEDHDYPGDQFPFTYVPLDDALSGRSGGILDRARASGVCPKLMHLDTDSEVWSARASLVVTDTAGNDIAMPDEVRVYLTTGIAHGDYPLPSAPVVDQATNPLTYGPILRALLKAMVEWVDDGREPPSSRFPSRGAGTLWTLDQFLDRWPKALGVAPLALNQLLPRDAEGQASGDTAYPVFVPAIDGDGNGVSGIRHPLLAAASGTHCGWTIRAQNFAPGHLYSVYGSYQPFAEGLARFDTREAWIAAAADAADALVADRLMLPEDAAKLRREGAKAADPFHLI